MAPPARPAAAAASALGVARPRRPRPVRYPAGTELRPRAAMLGVARPPEPLPGPQPCCERRFRPRLDGFEPPCWERQEGAVLGTDPKMRGLEPVNPQTEGTGGLGSQSEGGPTELPASQRAKRGSEKIKVPSAGSGRLRPQTQGAGGAPGGRAPAPHGAQMQPPGAAFECSSNKRPTGGVLSFS